MAGSQPNNPNSAGSERENCWREYLGEIQRGNSQALAHLYDASAPMLYALALRILGNSADTEEVLLDVFEQVWRTAGTFDAARGGVWRWLAMLTRSRALDRLRSTASKRLHEHPTRSEAIEIGSSAPAPEEMVVSSQQQQLIRKALSALPAEQRRVVELAYFSGMTHTEMAAALGIPLGTIKTRVRTAMDRLRVALHPMMPGSSTNDNPRPA